MSSQLNAARRMTPWGRQIDRLIRNPGPPIKLAPVAEKDPTCPDCKGRCVDKHNFDCVRCGGEGVVDE